MNKLETDLVETFYEVATETDNTTVGLEVVIPANRFESLAKRIADRLEINEDELLKILFKLSEEDVPRPYKISTAMQNRYSVVARLRSESE